ncbi:hypothetical protein GCM10019016_089390 [Streptomyces prasinosporus]|uniref:Lipoprotein n=1 Tax=Streptomyces prasinosporus TaxID=68256 RepID=A0ABP6U2E0_9ACTN
MRLAHIVPVLLLAAAVTSCASSEPAGHGRTTEPATAGKAAPLPRISLPLDPYQISDEDFSTVSRALGVLTDRCMERKGFDYDVPAPQDMATAPTGHERRYGITVPETAAKHGYHLAGTPIQEQPRSPRSKRYERALTGTGKPLGTPGSFDDGCTGEAHRELESGIDMEAVDLPQWYKRESFQRSLEHPRVKTAFASWSDCMSAAGHHYASPLDPPEDPEVMGRKVTEHERAVAVADIECKQRTGLVRTWRDVEAALQRSTVTSRAAQLKKARAQAAKLVARSSRILAAEGR